MRKGGVCVRPALSWLCGLVYRAICGDRCAEPEGMGGQSTIYRLSGLDTAGDDGLDDDTLPSPVDRIRAERTGAITYLSVDPLLDDARLERT